LDNQEPLVVTDWTIRSFAMATADQFHALALKVGIVGFVEFAQELEAVSDALRSGQHDAVLAAVDREAIIASDTNLLDATVNAIDALTEQKEAA
jgi:predicted enzyme involved in methoxymalonyl-ACP biosynthesis